MRTSCAASGDKLLGGPQAGLILGHEDLVDRCARHPLARAMRCDKVTLATLAGTLAEHARTDVDVPTLTRLMSPPDVVKARAERVAQGAQGCPVAVVSSRGAVGSGALPTDGPELGGGA